MLQSLKDFCANTLGFLNDRQFCMLTYLLTHGRWANLNAPQSFNEKLLLMKLTVRDPFYKKLVDKYEVREYVEKTIGQEYLNELYGIYERFEDIDFNSLPEKFVLKITNSSKTNIICKDKKSLDYEKIKNTVKKWMKYDFYKRTREWQYKDVKPRIIIEKYLGSSDAGINDYKFFCFNGVPKFLEVDVDRFTEHKQKFYDLNWNELPMERSCKTRNEKIEKPFGFEKMVELSQRLSQGFRFVRVDLYNVDKKIYFGEMTFYPANCNVKFKPQKYNYIVGDYLDLN